MNVQRNRNVSRHRDYAKQRILFDACPATRDSLANILLCTTRGEEEGVGR